ncbi:hypothetical protein BDV12DRAFT_202507 [Aspergillus spectabilis]
MSLLNDADKGTLTRQKLRDYLAKGTNIDSTSSTGDTALGLAVKNGHTGVVKLLLLHNANPNKKSVDGRSPLYLVASAPSDKRVRLAQLLLQRGADINEPSPQFGNETPLMAAITHARDPKLIRLLVENGASLTQTNNRGETAKVLAGYSMNPAIQRALIPDDPRNAIKPELGNLLTSAGLFAIAYFSDWKDVAKDSIDRIAAFLAAEADTSKAIEDFKFFLLQYVQDNDLEDFYPPNDPRILDIARAAAAYRAHPTVKGLSARGFMILAAAQLYKPVLYLPEDDSGSMNYGPNGPDDKTTPRIVPARHMVSVIMDVLDFANPDAQQGIGVASLRFINKDIGSADGLTSAQVRDHMNAVAPNGGTAIGGNLKAKILNPLIYGFFNANQDLPKPYLIMTITDGAPNGEDVNTFRNEVAAVADTMINKHYSPSAVNFSLSQTGNDEGAKAFLDELINNPVPHNALYVASDRLDQEYERFKENYDEMVTYLVGKVGLMIDIM